MVATGEIIPYTRDEIKAKGPYYGRLLALHILGHGPDDIASRLGTDPRTVGEELSKLLVTRDTSKEWYDMLARDMGFFEHFVFELSPKGRDKLIKYQGST